MLHLTNSSTTTSITVEWDDISSGYCGVVYYEVLISLDNQEVDRITTTNLSATFQNLMNDTIYSVTVVAFNRIGRGTTATLNAMTRGNSAVSLI